MFDAFWLLDNFNFSYIRCRYRNRAQELSVLIKDQPMTGLQKSVWWIEYVIRHKGARHLRSPALDLPFYQYYLLDVIGTIFFVLILFLYLVHKLFLYVPYLFNFSSSKKLKSS